MPHHMRILLPASRARRTAGALMAAGLSALSVACSDAPTNVRLVDRPSLGKTPAGPAVTSASPAYARRDTTLDVHVFGSGFTAGAAAEWALAGVPNAAKVRTNSTTVVSASELVANITVSADADLAYWDVAVTLIGGKKGVGTEKFEVTTAQVLGGGIGGYVMGASEQVSAVGYGDLSGAWVYDNISGAAVDLGAGQAWGIDPTGTVALGRDGGFVAVAWTRDMSSGQWTRQTLPGFSGSGGGNATSAAIASDGTLLAGGWLAVTVARNQVNRPVVWRRANGAWEQQPIQYALPGAAASIYDVNEAGQAAGRTTSAGGTVQGVVWNNATTYALLDGIAYAINPAGTVVVGERAGTPVYWYRNGMTWAGNVVGTPLPSLSSSCAGGRAQDVNSAGIIVGYSCSTGGKNQGTVWRLDLSGPPPTLAGAPSRLSGLGQVGSGSDNTIAVAITSVQPYFAVGYVATGNNVTVRWPIP